MNAVLSQHLFQEEIYRPQEQVVVVLAKKWDDYSIDQQLLLAKILGSVKLSMSSVRIISDPVLSLSKLSSIGQGRILIFGSSCEGLSSYQQVQAQGFSVIKADDLSGLDDTKKKNLWQALRNMFGV